MTSLENLAPAFLKQKTPKTFGRYLVCSLLGEGAMGRVYLANDPVLDRQVAIKVITISAQTETRTRAEYLGRFSVEARASARLNHPSIVTIFDAGDEGGVPWIAFEYVCGDPLQHLLEQPEPLPVEKAVAITLDIASALHHAHESGIIHRDIKPANILIDKRTGIAKLADFGVVKAPWVALTQDGNAVGSPGYMSPEQLEGKGCDARSDLFSLGIVLYQMLSGKHPFMRGTIPATIFATLHGNYTPLKELRPECPAYLITIVTTLLDRDPDKRLQTAALLLHHVRSGSRPHESAGAFDKNAFLGNTTRLHRVSHALREQLKKSRIANKTGPAFFSAMRRHLLSMRPAFVSVISFVKKLPKRYAQFLPSLGVLTGIFGALVIVAVIALLRTADERSVAAALKQEGYRGSVARIIDSCNSLISTSSYGPARTIAEILTGSSRHRTEGYLLLSRTALEQGDDDVAIRSLTTGAATKDWSRVKNQSRKALIASCTKRLSSKKADSALVATLASLVLDKQRKKVASWTEQPTYWLRWNGVRLAALLDVRVDSVALYMLDLEHAGSVSTRTHAATRLGELGDTRAVAALKKAADLGLRDPILSYTADHVLKNYFNGK